jgi:hypothetical protein
VAANSITPELQRFIAKYIRSVEALEVLCLLHEDPTKTWRVPEVLHRIQSSANSVAGCLEEFRLAGLLTKDAEEHYRFAPGEKDFVERVPMLAKTYRERRVSVIECIYAKPSDPIQDFANAFRLRKEK